MIGIWTTASRQRVQVWDADRGVCVDSGPCRQVSRLGNPLVNEVLIPLGKKDLWNSLPPSDDKLFTKYVASPDWLPLLPGLYPGYSPGWRRWSSRAAADDLEAILLTGLPPGMFPASRTSPARCPRTCSA